MPDLTPMTREEKFLNGDTDLTPITRREHFYAGTESELPEPDPITREEWFIQKYRGGGGGDITVESLSVTENGTYTAPSGKAYSPVEVNVPLPQNAYLLKSVANLPQAIASFNDGQDMVMPSLKVAIEPQQEGSGDPSPTNIRPISGWDEANVSVSGVNVFNINSCENGYLNESGVFVPYSGFYCTPYLNIKPNIAYSLAYNRINTSSGNGMRIAWYDKNKTFIRRDGGAESGTSGEKIITETAPSNAYYCRCSLVDSQEKYMFVIGSITDLSSYTPYTDFQTYTIDLDGTRYGGELDVVSGVLTVDRAVVDMGAITWSYTNGRFYYNPTNAKVYTQLEVANLLCSQYPTSQYSSQADNSISSYTGYIYVRADSYSGDTSAFKTAVTGQQLVYELATPLTIQLTPTAVKSLLGSNNVWADTGDIKDAEYFSKEV